MYRTNEEGVIVYRITDISYVESRDASRKLKVCEIEIFRLFKDVLIPVSL